MGKAVGKARSVVGMAHCNVVGKEGTLAGIQGMDRT